LPTASIDFTIATLAIILIAASAIYGVNMVAAPYLDQDPNREIRYYQIGRGLLLSEGTPEGWGTGATPTKIGLAKGGEFYRLDIDKVSRLNPENDYSINYSTLWGALGVEDISFHISMRTLFDVTLKQDDSTDNGDNTTYFFSVVCHDDGYSLETSLTYYLQVRDAIYTSSGTTDSNGLGVVQFTIPDSVNGTALLIAVARLYEGIVSYDVLTFAHKTGETEKPEGFVSLSPLDDILFVNLAGNSSVLTASLFTYEYNFTLTPSGGDYVIPSVLDTSPGILAVTGVNGSDYWAEWVAYPQIPLEVGAAMDADHVISDVILCRYLVEVNGVHYQMEIKFRSPEEYE
jgi:hypothetical protein